MTQSRKPRQRAPGPVLGYQDGIPIVPVTVEFGIPWGLLRLAACPYCGRPHVHGGPRPGQDPHECEGHRVADCVSKHVPEDRQGDVNRGYILRIVEDTSPNDHRARELSGRIGGG
jgi:hypothetical protein